MSNKKSKIVEETVDFSQVAANIEKSTVTDFIHDNFLPFAYYVIMNRALISDDGLKPVNRRIIHTMYEMGLTPNKPYAKAARISGETMGVYHPHGNTSIEDALARMAQDFQLRVPLIANHGAVGKKAGDVASSARYWEAKLTPAAVELIKEVNDNAVPLIPNFDGTRTEPVILPARFPNGIINGSQGIAVGYACDIPPHNPTEIMQGAIAVVENPEITVEELMEIVLGPDMPSGGELIGIEGVESYFKTGSGTFTIRGKYELTALPRGRHQITFYELPYQVSPEKIAKGIKDAKAKGHLKGLAQYKSLGDRNNPIREVFISKSGVNPSMLLKELFRHTSLEQKFSANMTVLHDGKPQVLDLKELLVQFVEFRESCTLNSSMHRIKKVEKQVLRLEGLLKVIVDIDKAIEIIRKSEDVSTARVKLMKSFKVDEEQANYILSMPLRKLTKSDKLELETEVKDLNAEVKELNEVLSNPERLNEVIIRELNKTLQVIGDERRTTIINKSAEALAEEERKAKKEITASNKNTECYVTMFANGTITKTEKPFKQERKALPIITSVRTKTQEDLVVVMADGTGHKVPVSYVPMDEVVSLDILGVTGKLVAGIGRIEMDRSDHGLLVVTKSGGVNVINGGYPTTATEFVSVKLPEGDEVVTAVWVQKTQNANDNILLVSSDGYVTSFALSEVRTSNSGAGTVRGMDVEAGCEVVSASLVQSEGVIASCTHSTIKTTLISDIPGRKRGAKGVILHKLNADDDIISAYATSSKEIVAYKKNKVIKLPEPNARAAKGEDRSGTDVVLGHYEII